MSTRDFDLAPAGAFARAFPLILGATFVFALLVNAVLVSTGSLDYRALLWMVPALFVAIAVSAALTWALRHPRVRFEDGALVVGRFPRVRAQAAEFALDAARVVDLDAEPGLRPVFRLLGTSLPGYRGGWFRLRDGTRAFLLVTDAQRVLLLPRHQGGPLLLSVTAPDTLLATLRRAHG
jgi:hypothetical protein